MAPLALAGTITACGGDYCVSHSPGFCANDKSTPAAPAAPLAPTDPAAPEATLAMPQLRVTPQSVKALRFSWDDVAGETGYVLLEDPDGRSGFSPVASLAADSTAHELTVFLPERVNARYVLQACTDNACADSAAVGVSDRLASAIAYFKASNAEAQDQFGASLALSADGRTLAVAAPREDSASAADPGGNSASDSGAVYVFTRSGSSWQQQGLLKASNAATGQRFGSSLAMSADGQALAVGAPLDGGGAAYVFSRDGGVWTQRAYLRASNTGDVFGFALAMAGDGRTLAVGAPNEDGGSTGINGDPDVNTDFLDSGAVYVFTRGDDPASWTQQAYVKAANSDQGDLFGGRLALSHNGDTLAVGSHLEDSSATGVAGNASSNDAVDSGAVYVFLRSGGSWSQQAYVKASNSAAGDRFGTSLALSADGSVMAVGSPREDSDAAGTPGASLDSGAVYLFQYQGAAWTQQALLKATHSDVLDQFGTAVALSPDGTRLAVGAFREDSQSTGLSGDPGNNGSEDSGAVYLFTGQGGGHWAKTHFLKASNTGNGDLFGTSLALGGDAAAPVLAVGAPLESGASQGMGGDQSTEGSAQSGAVYLY